MARPVSSGPGPRIRSTGEPPRPSTAVSSARATAFSPSTRVTFLLQPAGPMSCLHQSVQPVPSTPLDSPPRGRGGRSSLRTLGDGTTREPAELPQAYCSRLCAEFQMVNFATLDRNFLRVSRRHLRVRGDRLHPRAIPASRRRSHCEAMHQERSQGAGSRRPSPRIQPSPCAAGTRAESGSRVRRWRAPRPGGRLASPTGGCARCGS